MRNYRHLVDKQTVRDLGMSCGRRTGRHAWREKQRELSLEAKRQCYLRTHQFLIPAA